MTGVGDDSRGRLLGRPWLIVGFLLAIAATLALVLSDDLRYLRLGIIAALWAALIGAFLAVRYRRTAVNTEEAVAEAQALYELELEREIAARREYELEMEAETRKVAESKSRDELEALRSEVVALRDSLQKLFGGEVLLERVALTAQATRMRSLSDENRLVTAGPENGKSKKRLTQLIAGKKPEGERERPTELIDRVLESDRRRPAGAKPTPGPNGKRPAGKPEEKAQRTQQIARPEKLGDRRAAAPKSDAGTAAERELKAAELRAEAARRAAAESQPMAVPPRDADVPMPEPMPAPAPAPAPADPTRRDLPRPAAAQRRPETPPLPNRPEPPPSRSETSMTGMRPAPPPSRSEASQVGMRAISPAEVSMPGRPMPPSRAETSQAGMRSVPRSEASQAGMRPVPRSEASQAGMRPVPPAGRSEVSMPGRPVPPGRSEVSQAGMRPVPPAGRSEVSMPGRPMPPSRAETSQAGMRPVPPAGRSEVSMPGRPVPPPPGRSEISQAGMRPIGRPDMSRPEMPSVRSALEPSPAETSGEWRNGWKERTPDRPVSDLSAAFTNRDDFAERQRPNRQPPPKQETPPMPRDARGSRTNLPPVEVTPTAPVPAADPSQRRPSRLEQFSRQDIPPILDSPPPSSRHGAHRSPEEPELGEPTPVNPTLPESIRNLSGRPGGGRRRREDDAPMPPRPPMPPMPQHGAPADNNNNGGGRRRRPENEQQWDGVVAERASSSRRGMPPVDPAENGNGNGHGPRRSNGHDAGGSHAAGRSVSELLAANGRGNPPRRRRRAED